jgi:hypothetical protein
VDYIEDKEDTDTIYWLLSYLVKQVTSYDEESCDVNIMKSLKLLKATKPKPTLKYKITTPNLVFYIETDNLAEFQNEYLGDITEIKILKEKK